MHLLRTRLCWQMLPPRHSLHRLLMRPWSRISAIPRIPCTGSSGACSCGGHARICAIPRIPCTCSSRAQALLTLAPTKVMLAYARFPDFFALALAALVWTEVRPQHSLHWLLARVCSHIFDPPHSVHRLFRYLLGHMLDPIVHRVRCVIPIKLFRKRRRRRPHAPTNPSFSGCRAVASKAKIREAIF